MTPEEKSLLERTYKMAEENNHILRGIRRSNRYGIAAKIFYWVVIIGITFGAFYYLQPYLNSMVNLIEQAQKAVQSVNGTVSQAQNIFGSVTGSTTKK
ncbi:MAG: hypothetical protein WCS89_00675 [Candidatus Paceibacterota bacterium]|jgi:hypothetical protein